MRIAYDMAAYPPASRLRAFREMLAGALDGATEANSAVDYTFRDIDFTARFEGRIIGEIGLARGKTSRHVAKRSAGQARRSTEEKLLVGINLDSSFGCRQDGREGVVEANDAMFLVTSRPYEGGTSTDGRQLFLQFPKQALTDRFGPIDDLTATAFSAKLPVQRLTTRFFVALAEIFDELDDVVAEGMVAQGLDLLTAAMSQQLGSTLSNTTTHRSALLFRIKTFILSRLRNPDFALDDVAATFGVSPRHINGLLSAEHTSFGRFVLAKRLDGCRRDLIDPTRAGRAVSDIAFSWGFNDAAHFSRTFKARFDVSPRQCRYAAFGALRDDAVLSTNSHRDVSVCPQGLTI